MQPKTLTLGASRSPQSGIAQLATAAILLAFLSFASGWRMWLPLELGAYFLASGSALLIYVNSHRYLPLKTLAEAWLPLTPIQLVAFLGLFGIDLVIAEDSSTLIGILFLGLATVHSPWAQWHVYSGQGRGLDRPK